jgi:glutathione peroxidase
LAKIDVNGDKEDPVFTFLKNEQPEEEVIGMKNKMSMAAIKKISKTFTKKGDITWNFTKFLVDKEGNVIKRYDPTFDPRNIEKDIIELIND